jgi:O-antigen ligase
MALVAAVFCLLSSPRVLVNDFETSLTRALVATAVVAVVTLPWLRVPVVPWPWLAFLGLCALSITWSISPSTSASALLLYAEITAMALVIGANVDLRVLAWGIALGGVVIVGLSLYVFREDLAGASLPVLGGGRRLTGVGGNTNILAYTLTLSLAAILATPWPRRLVARLAWVAVLLVHGYGLYRAESGTGYVSAAALLVTVVLLWVAPRLHGRGRRALWMSVVAACALMAGTVYVVVHVLHKDLWTFSSRGPLWAATIETARDHWFLGWGWGAVWNHAWHPAPDNDVVQSIYANAGIQLTHGHNYFIDVLPQLGVAGVIVCVLMLVHVIRLAVRAGSVDTAPGLTRLVVLVVVGLLTFGITEPMLSIPVGWWTLTTVAGYAALAVGRPAARSRHRASRSSRYPGRRGGTRP